jgi:transcriptional regulator with XRE-family HTH domain
MNLHFPRQIQSERPPADEISMTDHAASSDAFPAQPEARVGARLRALRLARRLSISGLAERAGVSTGMVSQIERDLSNPSVRMLERLRVALDVPLTALLDDAGGQSPTQEFVRRARDRPHFTVGPNGLEKALLSPNGQHDLQFMLITIPPGGRSAEVLLGDGEKAGLVMQGKVALRVGDQEQLLSEGDSFQFSSRLPHQVENPADTPAQVLWIMNTRVPVIHL